MDIINSEPLLSPYDINDEYLNSLIQHKYIICKLKGTEKEKDIEYTLNLFNYYNEEIIRFSHPRRCYCLPNINNNTSDEYLIIYITTFRYLNPTSTLNDIKIYLKSNNILYDRIASLYSKTSIYDRKNYYFNWRTYLFNDNLIINKYKFTNRQYDEYIQYKKKIQNEKKLESRLKEFKDKYNNSNKTIRSIQELYRNRLNCNGRDITTMTILKYSKILNLEIEYHTRKNIDYEKIIKECIIYNKEYYISYENIVEYIKRIYKMNISTKTLERYLKRHPEIIKLLNKHNINKDIIKFRKGMKTKKIIIKELYNKLGSPEYMTKDNILSIQETLLEEGNECSFEYVLRTLKNINSSFKYIKDINRKIEIMEEEEVKEVEVEVGPEDNFNYFVYTYEKLDNKDYISYKQIMSLKDIYNSSVEYVKNELLKLNSNIKFEDGFDIETEKVEDNTWLEKNEADEFFKK